MTITKFGHSCLLIEEAELRALIDPGIYSTGQNELKNIDAVLITHEHSDHLDISSLRAILQNNPSANVYSNEGVVAILEKEGIVARAVKGGDSFSEKEVLIEVFGNDHAVLHSTIPQIRNVGYFIAGRFFYPGDALTNPGKPIEILALPVTAPWSKLQESIDYAIARGPKACIAVHDGILAKNFSGPQRITGQVLEPTGIQFLVPEIGKSYEF